VCFSWFFRVVFHPSVLESLYAATDFTAAVSDEAACSTEFKIKVKYRRALAHFDLKMYEASISDATEVLQLDATHVNARSLLGKAYKIIHEYQKAEEQLTNAILIESDQAHLYAGKCLPV
jgi:tetratricopeptide (TPR) repeat protein